MTMTTDADDARPADEDYYDWTSASALWQVQHGNANTLRTDSAVAYLERRLGIE
jgi:hypothetical protein